MRRLARIGAMPRQPFARQSSGGPSAPERTGVSLPPFSKLCCWQKAPQVEPPPELADLSSALSTSLATSASRSSDSRVRSH